MKYDSLFLYFCLPVIGGPDTSKEHCFIENTTGNVVLNPLSSLCTINGNKIAKPKKLYQGKNCFVWRSSDFKLIMCQPNVNELSSLFEFMCMRFGTCNVRRLKLGLRN
jgi:hypothetical protein